MIGSVAGGSAAQPSVGEALGNLGSDAFLKLMVAQMRFQNPMQPNDPGAMLQQTATFTQVESLKQLASVQQTLLGLSQAAISANLVGKTVTAAMADGSTTTGVVDGVRFTPDGPLLLVGDTDVPLEAATEIRGSQPGTSSEPPPASPPGSAQGAAASPNPTQEV